MKQVTDFCKQHRYAIIWTICYILVMWAILLFLFNFDMFSSANWSRLFHSKLRGFPGFVFGILILAAIPMYIATTTIIVRKRAPLFKIQIPKFLQPTPLDEPKPQTTTRTPENAQESEKTGNELPPNLPNEMRVPYIRARNNMGRMQQSTFNSGPISAQPVTSNTAANSTPSQQNLNGLPPPNDFDIDDINDNFDTSVPTFTPMFQDLDFDAPTPGAESNTPDDATAITEYLTQHGRKFTIENGIVITDTDAIITHADPDFWIADNETWFAAGRQKPSPTDAILSLSAARGVRPVLYLAQTNILDLDARCAQWRQDGITVITSPTELS